MSTILQKAAGSLGNLLNQPIYTISGGSQLPDFHVSEWLTNYANKPSTTQSYAQSTPPPQSIPTTGGSVLGTKTTSQVSYPTSSVQQIQQQDNGANAAAEEAARREAEVRSAIESGYNQYQTGLQGLQSTFQTGQNDELTSASKTYDQIFGGLTDQKTSNLAGLDASRTAVNTRKAQSIKDLQQNLSNTMRGASMQFGAMGAGDTSATRTMLPYAYTKLAGVQEGSIARQANDQQFTIDQQQKDTELEFSKMWRQTEIDKETSLSDIKKYYGERIANVQTAMVNAPLEKANSLATLSQSLLEEAQANLRQLEAEHRQNQENVKTWATNRMSELNNMKLSLAGTANFSPQNIVWNELSTSGLVPTASGQEASYNPLLLAQKKRQEYLGQ
ncbi:MAG: hypothetical protein HY865_22615 [Chloroflexi bacterium]|nr:hypothetical protein [Chloroflexota bacterium]